ncbi:MAG TPA: hypothetical protein VFW25_08960 [Silvibacterium sp.]|nr:hypothetical protein [Silvibacterium sp.]
MTNPAPPDDSDAHKGATETEENLSGQLPHRTTTNQNTALTGDNGTDFPEPGSNPEHTGEKSSKS